MRKLDYFCETCQDVRPHEVDAIDPGSCHCVGCGRTQVLMKPLER
jgi:hypothetical protein